MKNGYRGGKGAGLGHNEGGLSRGTEKQNAEGRAGRGETE